MRFATDGEQFHGIGMKEAIQLKPNQVVICDAEKLIAVYPYRDSDDTKVTTGTKRMHIVSCGVPGISRDSVRNAYGMCADFLKMYCGGSSGEILLSP